MEDTNLERHGLLADEDLEKQEAVNAKVPHPFKRWYDSFRPRKRDSSQRRYVEGWSDSSSHDSRGHRSSVSESSQFETVLTASTSVTSQCMLQSRPSVPDRKAASMFSDSGNSGDSPQPSSSNHPDEATDLRAIKRRHILRELVTTECDYVLGLKALTGILTIFNIRRKISDNVQEILDIHELFLTKIQASSPMSALHAQRASDMEFTSKGISKRLSTNLGSLRGLKQGSLRSRTMKASVNERLKTLTADPAEALDVARNIEELSRSFSAYDEYCANYELFSHDVALLRQKPAEWTIYDRGIEAMAKSVASTERRRHDDSKSMTFNDLLIKPIQRLCKYPLMLQDLLRATPASDCPFVHDEIQQILDGTRKLVGRINLATGNPVYKDRISKTMLLREKIDVGRSVSDSKLIARAGIANRPKNGALRDVYQDLGAMVLCGVLHVTYQTTEATIAGEFMVCALFNRYMLFAKGVDDLRRLEAVACVYLDKVKFDVLQNGRGLCCYECIFSWKLLFQDRNANYEFVLSASSAAEERHWNTEILRLSAALAEVAQPRSGESEAHAFSALRLAPLDQVQYQVSSLARRSCMDSVSVASKYEVQHVILRKTHYPRHVEEPTAQLEGEIERPKTPPEGTSVTLVARRIDRIRLERLIADIWSRDLLPTPGMVLGRGDLFRRRPLMKNLSIHTAFHKRSASVGVGVTPRKPPSVARPEFDEEKEIGRSSEVFEDKEDKEIDYQPRTPITPQQSKTTRLPGSTRTASPRSEARSSQEDSPVSGPSPKKWSSPKSLFSALAPRKLKKAPLSS
ncbi:unnamed protein product [Penicillium olsonii]|nr:unnamed protein product [Penicillium olsonii]